MQTATQRAAPVPAGGHINGFSSVVSDLKSLIAHVEASIKLIEAAIQPNPIPEAGNLTQMSWSGMRPPPTLRR